MLDLRRHDEVAQTLRDAVRHFEKGAPPPVGARELLAELADALARSSPRETGLRAPSWLKARDIARAGVAGLRDERPEVQAREAKTALRKLSELFESHARRGNGDAQPLVGGRSSSGDPDLPRLVSAALLVVVIASMSIGIVVEKLAFGEVVGILLLLWLGVGFTVKGLSPGETLRRARKASRVEGYVFQRLGHRLTLPLVRFWWVTWGLIFLAALGYGLWRNWPSGRYGYSANLTSDFRNICDGDFSVAQCECILTRLEATVPASALAAFDQALQSGNPPAPEWFARASGLCTRN